MRIVDAYYQILDPLDGQQILSKIERIARVCYKSEDKIAKGTAASMVRMLISRGHEAMIEHFSFSVKFFVDRGVSHELVRHRIASFAQESTRYVNYGKEGEVVFVRPSAGWARAMASWNEKSRIWYHLCEQSEKAYLRLLEEGCPPQEARSVLVNSTKTEIVITANLREWRHLLKLRTALSAHPDMRYIMRKLCLELKEYIPVIFDDITWENK